MRRPRSLLTTAATLLLATVLTAASTAPQATALARLSLAEPNAEIASRGGGWQQALEGAEISAGESVRIEAGAVARIELPWMALTLTSGARLHFADGLLLAAVLESGRMLVESETSDIMRLVAGEAEIRGHGRLVVRREARAASVSCLAGRFHVMSPAGVVSLHAGQGTRVLAGRPPSSPMATPEAPDGLWPGDDPVYQTLREPLDLRWNGEAPRYAVELLPVGTEVVLLHREVDRPAVRLAIPWAGAFRWRVSACDATGLEGVPSKEGLIAVE